jgi:AcrR family transcriptional regulator
MAVKVANRRGRRRLDEGPALSQAQLIAVLLDLAGREGAEAVNMRRVAAEAGVSPRLLYSMVRDKTEMIDLLCEAIMAEGAPLVFQGAWKDRLRTIAQFTRRQIARYPGVPQWMLSRAAALPKAPLSRSSGEEILRALRDAGLQGEAVQSAYLLFAAFTLGHLVMTECADPGGEAIAPTGMENTFATGLEILLDGVERLGAATARGSPGGP